LNQFSDYSLIGNLSVTATLKHCVGIFHIRGSYFCSMISRIWCFWWLSCSTKHFKASCWSCHLGFGILTTWCCAVTHMHKIQIYFAVKAWNLMSHM